MKINIEILIIRYFTIPHTRGWYASFAKSFGNTSERVFFFKKTSALQPANAIKTKFLANSFQRFLGTANLKNNSFLFTG